MPADARVSVVVLTHNRLKELEQTLQPDAARMHRRVAAGPVRREQELPAPMRREQS